MAKDLEQATRIGLQGRTRHRVVTLSGGLIDTSGTMSGGGGKVASGGMRAKASRYSQEEVKGFAKAYEEAYAKLQQMRQEREAQEEAGGLDSRLDIILYDRFIHLPIIISFIFMSQSNLLIVIQTIFSLLGPFREALEQALRQTEKEIGELELKEQTLG